MKNNPIISYVLTTALLLAAGAAPAKEKPVLERGWMGGSYECAKSGSSLSERLFGADHTTYSFPSALEKSQTAGILMTSLATNTPAYAAGLREGDLILALDDQPVTDLPAFWQTVNGSHPGAPLVVKAYRAGQTVECRVTVGCEKYKRLHWFTIGLPGYLGPFHPVPTHEAPCFSLMAIGYENKHDAVEFGSVKEQYQHNCHPKDKQTGYDTDWRCWLSIFEVKSGKQIIAQELVTP